jgi:hypothetical protein
MIKKNLKKPNSKAWVVAVDMGYGHQRTAFPLRYLAPERKVINANSYQGIPEKDRKIWEDSRKFYEFISNFKRIPLLGEGAFYLFNQFQKISPFYPRRDLSKPTFSLKRIYSLIKKGWGKDLIEKLKRKPLPLISTFFIPAFMAEVHGYEGEIFCVICDADISRAWAPLNPQKSKIKYFAPTERVAERLKLYGVKKENIFLTGYPLPKENIGSLNSEIVKSDLAYRILNLDPKSQYRYRYKVLIEKYLGSLPIYHSHPLTIMFAVGGAGAQREIGIKIVKSLAKRIKDGEIKVVLVAGIKEEVKDYFLKHIRDLGLEKSLSHSKNFQTYQGDKTKEAKISEILPRYGGGVEIIFERDIQSYFKKFNEALRTTDILWTKPSELSFYTALGLPIIIAPSIGSQEDFNREWLLKLGSAIPQENPKYTNQWLFDYLKSGWFAEAAMQGFVEGQRLGVYNIEKIISLKK